MPLCGVVTACMSCLSFRHMSMKWLTSEKWLTETSSLWSRYLVSWVLFTTMSESSSSSSGSSIAVGCSESSVNSAVGESRTSWMTPSSSKSADHSPRTLQANTRIFFISSCRLVGPCESLTVSYQSFFQQPFWAVDSYSMDSVIFTMQSAILCDFQHSLTLTLTQVFSFAPKIL
jgi:hypothetical protein